MRRTTAVTTALSLTFALLAASATRGQDEGQDVQFSECPPAVQKTMREETHGAQIDVVHKQKEEDDTTYFASFIVGGKRYGIGVEEDGTLTEMSLDAGEEEVKFSACPAAVQKTFHKESNDAKIDAVTRDLKYGTIVFEAEVAVGGKDYGIIVAEDGTLVEKTLIIEDEPIELTECPPAVQKVLKELAKGGKIEVVTRSTGILGHVYEAEAEIAEKIYLLEVTARGMLLSKTLDQTE